MCNNSSSFSHVSRALQEATSENCKSVSRCESDQRKCSASVSTRTFRTTPLLYITAYRSPCDSGLAGGVEGFNRLQFLDPETALQTLQTLLLLLLLFFFFFFFFVLSKVLRLFHFSNNRRQTSHTDWCQYYPQSHCVGFSS